MKKGKFITEQGHLIYNTPISSFKKRLWTLFAPYLILYGIMLAPLFFNLDGYQPILFSYFIVVLLLSLHMLWSCYRWAFRKVSGIRMVDGNIHIAVMEKDVMRDYSIPIQHLKLSKQRVWARPRLFKLTVSNSKNKVFELYAATFKENSDMDFIKHSLEKQIG